MAGGDAARTARTVAQLVRIADPISAAELVGSLIDRNRETAVAVCIELARMANPGQELRDAHAAYSRGVRTPLVVALNRQYDRERKAAARRYAARRAGGV